MNQQQNRAHILTSKYRTDQIFKHILKSGFARIISTSGRSVQQTYLHMFQEICPPCKNEIIPLQMFWLYCFPNQLHRTDQILLHTSLLHRREMWIDHSQHTSLQSRTHQSVPKKQIYIINCSTWLMRMCIEIIFSDS